MKKLFLILIITLLAFVGYGQNVGQITMETKYQMATATDTLLKFPYDLETNNFTWRIDVLWDSVAVTRNGILSIKCTGLPGTYATDAAWVDYPNMSSVTIDSETGYCSFEDDGMAARRIGLYFDKNSIGAKGYLRVYMTLKPR